MSFNNLIYYNTTKHESHTLNKKKKHLCPHTKQKWNREWTQNPNGDGDVDGDGDGANDGGHWVTELRYLSFLGGG